jgi:glycosyltransferase involved in cell wall biosynthesis
MEDQLAVNSILEGLRISFIAGTLRQGGAERQLFYMLKTLREHRAELELLSLTGGEFWESRIKEIGVPVIWVGQSPSRISRLVRIIQEVRQFKPLIVHSQHFYTNIYAAIAARATQAREVCAIRNDVTTEVKDTGMLLGYLSLRAPRCLAPNSHNGVCNATKLGVSLSRLQFVPNVVDSEHFCPHRSRREGVNIIGVGRLHEQKRFDRFIRVFSRLTQDSSIRARGIVVGSGSQRTNLLREASNCGLSPDRFEIRDVVQDPLTIYQDADILLLTSDTEGTPNVVLEAMSCSLPVVATRVGDVPALVKHGETGFVFDPEDEESMVCALRRLCKDPDLRLDMGQKARRFVEAHHSLKVLPDRLGELYGKARADR